MEDPNITWWVTFYNDYPTENGLSHVYCANASIDGSDISMSTKIIPSLTHEADSCFIDHSSRIQDVVVPESFKVELKQYLWLSYKINSELNP